MPAQHCVRADQQPQAAQSGTGQRGEQGGEEGPIRRGEPHPLGAELPLQNDQLMPQREDFRVLVAVGHR